MGGALLKLWDLPEKRISNNEYEALFEDVRNFLHLSEFKNNPVFLKSPALRNKETHGDLDIISNVSKQELINCLKKNNALFHVNSNTISLPWKGFQVDISCLPENQIESAINYCSWGDTGNLIGRTAHKFGLHFGHTGLSFWIRQSLFDNSQNFIDNDNIFEKVVLSTDYSIILPLLGYDFERWKQGFNTEEEVFEWVATSKYFNEDIFKFEELNHINRIRNKKRKMYANFVGWVAANGWKYDKFSFQRREYYLPIWVEKFPNLREKIKENKARYLRSKQLKDKLNGYIVMDVCGISDGKLVGKIVSKVHERFSTQEIINSPHEKIREVILDIYGKISECLNMKRPKELLAIKDCDK